MSPVAAAPPRAGNPKPQTTQQAPGGPFRRYSQPGKKRIYDSLSNAFGALVAPPMVSIPGYARKLMVRIAASGGVNGSVTVATKADAPYNAVGLLTLEDAYGTVLANGPGYEMLFLVPKYSGLHGLFGAADISSLPSFSAVSTGASGTGNFIFNTAIPIEYAAGRGLISMADSTLLPRLSFTLNPSSSVFSTAPGTLPVIEVRVGGDFFWRPELNVAPTDLGTTVQHVLSVGNPVVSSGASLDVTLPRQGGYVPDLIFILRDSTGARIDAWPDPVRIFIDGVPYIDARLDEVYDDMYNQFGQTARPTGVMAFTRKTSLSQISLGLLDSGELFLSTNPGTSIQFEGMPWGTISNSPATLTAIIGQVVPRKGPAGAMTQIGPYYGG